MLDACETQYMRLVAQGVNEDVAADRTYDVYEKVYDGLDRPIVDSRDRLFESKLKTIVKKG